MSTVKQNQRKAKALIRLEAQLVSGVKPSKVSDISILLTEADKKRIIREINTLKSRV